MDVVMPRLGDTMEDGTLVAWRKQVGEAVRAGDILCEIETDKSTVEFEAEDSGTLVALYVKAGDVVPVGTAIACIE